MPSTSKMHARTDGSEAMETVPATYQTLTGRDQGALCSGSEASALCVCSTSSVWLGVNSVYPAGTKPHED